jgi:hypothetical protein
MVVLVVLVMTVIVVEGSVRPVWFCEGGGLGLGCAGPPVVQGVPGVGRMRMSRQATSPNPQTECAVGVLAFPRKALHWSRDRGNA